MSIFSDKKEIALEKFKEFNEKENNETYLDDNVRKRLTDEEAKVAISEITDFETITEIKNIPKTHRDELLARIMKIEGLTQRQAARILGISPNLIFKL